MARKRRQLVVMGAEHKGGPAPLGQLRELKEMLASYNTAPDGGRSDTLGVERLHGPGMVVELPTGVEVVQQAIASLNDEDIAFPVLFKLCKNKGWRLMDLESGRMFG